MKNIDGKESNTPKGGNIATEFNEFKDTLFNNKKEFKPKSINLEHRKSTKYHYLFSTTKYLF